MKLIGGSVDINKSYISLLGHFNRDLKLIHPASGVVRDDHIFKQILLKGLKINNNGEKIITLQGNEAIFKKNLMRINVGESKIMILNTNDTSIKIHLEVTQSQQGIYLITLLKIKQEEVIFEGDNVGIL